MKPIPDPGPEPAAKTRAEQYGDLIRQFDRFRDAKSSFQASRAAERHYLLKLKSVAGRVGQIVAGRGDASAKTALLRRYAETLTPWAENAAAAMLSAASRANWDAWKKQSAAISQGLSAEMTRTGANGITLQDMIRAQADRIRTIPDNAAEKIPKLVEQASVEGWRSDTLATKIAGLGDVAHFDARRIAHGAIAGASTNMTRMRAQELGGTGYIWRTAGDGDVRESHRAMEGRFVEWENPPTLDGFTGHAGEGYFCRCYPEPVIPDPDRPAAPPKSPLPTWEEVQKDPQKGLQTVWERQNREVVPHEDGKPLWNADIAQFDAAKLSRYVLDPAHSRGGDKARVMAAALGAGPKDAAMIRRQILSQLPKMTAARPALATDQYGERFRVRMPVTGPNGRTVDVVTAWIYDRDPDRRQSQAAAPRLITMFVAPKTRGDDS